MCFLPLLQLAARQELLLASSLQITVRWDAAMGQPSSSARDFPLFFSSCQHLAERHFSSLQCEITDSVSDSLPVVMCILHRCSITPHSQTIFSPFLQVSPLEPFLPNQLLQSRSSSKRNSQQTGPISSHATTSTPGFVEP